MTKSLRIALTALVLAGFAPLAFAVTDPTGGNPVPPTSPQPHVVALNTTNSNLLSVFVG